MKSGYDFNSRYKELKQEFLDIKNSCWQFGGKLELGEGNRITYSKILLTKCQKYAQGVHEFYQGLHRDAASKEYNLQKVDAIYPLNDLSEVRNIPRDENFVDNLGDFLGLYDNVAIS